MTDRSDIEKRETYTATVAQRSSGIYCIQLTLTKGWFDRQTIGDFTSKARAERVRKELLDNLNHPKELAARVDAKIAEEKAAEKARAAEQRKCAASIRERLLDAAKRSDFQLAKGDVALVYHGGYSARTAKWYEVEVVGDNRFMVAEWGNESRTDAVADAKEGHPTSRILSVNYNTHQLKVERKGPKVGRQYGEAFRVYRCVNNGTWRNRTLSYEALYRDAKGHIVEGRNSWHKDLKFIQFATEDEATAWLKGWLAEKGYDNPDEQIGYFSGRYVVRPVNVPVKKAKVSA